MHSALPTTPPAPPSCTAPLRRTPTSVAMALARALTRLATAPAAAAAPAVSAALSTAGSHALPDLPYDYAELEPVISGEIMELHHSKHHNTYVTNLNAALAQYGEAEKAGDVAKMIALQGCVCRSAWCAHGCT